MTHEERINKLEKQITVLKRMVKEALGEKYKADAIKSYKKLNEIYRLQNERERQKVADERRRNRELRVSLRRALGEIREVRSEVASFKDFLLRRNGE